MTTQLNANFEERIVIRPEDYQWLNSPMPGVERMMLDRMGDEVARATSIVRHAPFTDADGAIIYLKTGHLHGL